MSISGAGYGPQIEAFERESHERFPPDVGPEHESFTDEHGRLVRRWTSGGRRIEEIISLAPEVALDRLGVISE